MCSRGHPERQREFSPGPLEHVSQRKVLWSDPALIGNRSSHGGIQWRAIGNDQPCQQTRDLVSQNLVTYAHKADQTKVTKANLSCNTNRERTPGRTSKTQANFLLGHFEFKCKIRFLFVNHITELCNLFSPISVFVNFDRVLLCSHFWTVYYFPF